MENEELDLVVFKDEEDNEITMEVLDYFFYEGEEYAMLTEYDPNSACNACKIEDCSSCEHSEKVDVTFMKVVPVGEDEEEFLPIDEKLSNILLNMINSAEDEEDE
ncbi:MAG: DUF1292 domain-containing protein [Clostridiales bacterium]|nr:DUF1292 domain-containing protein [Clostridiales bacterium]